MSYYYELPKIHNLTFSTGYADDDPDHLSPSSSPFELVTTDATNSTTMLVSHTLNMYLCGMKEQIEECGEETWDNLKKYTNPFEFIHTSIPNCKIYTVSKLRPLSRSFYKMIELYATFFNSHQDPKTMTSFHLAEGPGGFIEALVHIRSRTTAQCQTDVHYGMTLMSTDSSCPGWKKSKGFLEMHRNRVCIETGADGTGNIISSANFEHCVSKYKNTCHLITADGGFDFSCDFNNQETMVLRLLIAEMGFALALQKKGGHFILKVFDTFTKPTIDVLYVLCNLYQEVYVSKPCTSRHANSERYIVCKHFKLSTSDALLPHLTALFKQLEDISNNATITSLLPIEHDAFFLNKIEECNAIIGQQQMETISTTINLILNKFHAEKLESMKRQNIAKCICWCDKHGVPYNRIMQPNNIFLKH
jgi:23S rRNA U2552 (ribose-2'-O)-methylase RlmE/FtsJ